MCLLTVAWCAAAAERPLAVFSIDEESITQMRKQHPLASAEVNDPVYKRKQRYQGLWLSDVLKDLSQGRDLKSDVYVRFRCKDGYLPIMPLARALGGKALIAIRDADASQGEDWQPIRGVEPPQLRRRVTWSGFRLQAMSKNTHGPIRWSPSNWSLPPTY